MNMTITIHGNDNQITFAKGETEIESSMEDGQENRYPMPTVRYVLPTNTNYLQIQNTGQKSNGDLPFKIVIDETFSTDIIPNGINKVYDPTTKPSTKDIQGKKQLTFKWVTEEGFEGILSQKMDLVCSHQLKMRVNNEGMAQDVQLTWDGM